MAHTCDLSTWTEGRENQELKDSLGYMRAFLEKKMKVGREMVQ